MSHFPRLKFLFQDARLSCVRLPSTSTCTLELFLPKGVAGAADLLTLLSRAVHEALGFTHLQTEGYGEDNCTQVKTGLWGGCPPCLAEADFVTLTHWLRPGSCDRMKEPRLVFILLYSFRVSCTILVMSWEQWCHSKRVGENVTWLKQGLGVLATTDQIWWTVLTHYSCNPQMNS